MPTDALQAPFTAATTGAYMPGFRYAPEPKTPSLRKGPMITFARAGTKTGDKLSEEAGGVIGGVIASLIQLDHFLRRCFDMGYFQKTIKFELGKLVSQSDKVLTLCASQYDMSTGNTALRMAGVLGQSAELMMRLSPRQVRSSLMHQHEMVEQNIDYVPVPVASRGLLPTTDGWLLVAVESPYGFGDVEENLRYLRACLRDCLGRRETPLAAHGLLTQPGVVNHDDEAERQLSAEAGVVWTQYAQLTVVYTDLGMSPGMKEAVARATHEGRQVEYRTLPGWAPEGEAVEVSAVAIGQEESE